MTLLSGVFLLLSALGYAACAIIHPSPRFKVTWACISVLFASLAALHFGMAISRSAREPQKIALPAEAPPCP